MLVHTLADTMQEPAGLLSGDEHFDAETLVRLHQARRVLVLGSSGAGKTHLSRRLAAILGLDPIHLDDHFWLRDGRPRPDREWRRTVSDLAARDHWIMDGTYERSLDLRIPRAEAIVLLECCPDVCLERVLQREQATPSPQWLARAGGAPTNVDRHHVQYVSHYASTTRPAVLESIERHGRGKTVAVLEAPTAVEPFFSQL